MFEARPPSSAFCLWTASSIVVEIYWRAQSDFVQSRYLAGRRANAPEANVNLQTRIAVVDLCMPTRLTLRNC